MATTEQSVPKAVFNVNAPVLISMNDEMARQVISVLDDQAKERSLPPAVFAFKCALENDLNSN